MTTSTGMGCSPLLNRDSCYRNCNGHTKVPTPSLVVIVTFVLRCPRLSSDSSSCSNTNHDSSSRSSSFSVSSRQAECRQTLCTPSMTHICILSQTKRLFSSMESYLRHLAMGNSVIFAQGDLVNYGPITGGCSRPTRRNIVAC